jgi:chromosome segregation ATPase
VVNDRPASRSIDDRVHDALTDGYAHALALDAECVRLLRRITDLAAGGAERSSDELRRLTERLREAQEQLAELRSSLAQLRAEADPTDRLL